jgi:hypothetical protein
MSLEVDRALVLPYNTHIDSNKQGAEQMEAFKTWEQMTPLEQYACTYWDMYKDANGVRPRGIDTTSWTLEQFEAEFVQLGRAIEQAEIARKAAEAEAQNAFEMRVQGLLMSGAKDRAMALRWIHEAEGSDGDEDYLCYLLGLPYGYFRKVDRVIV